MTKIHRIYYLYAIYATQKTNSKVQQGFLEELDRFIKRLVLRRKTKECR